MSNSCAMVIAVAVRDAGVVLRDGIVELEPSLLDQLEDHGRRHGLGVASDPEVVICPQRHVRADGGGAEGLEPPALAALVDQHDCARDGVVLQRLLDQRLRAGRRRPGDPAVASHVPAVVPHTATATTPTATMQEVNRLFHDRASDHCLGSPTLHVLHAAEHDTCRTRLAPASRSRAATGEKRVIAMTMTDGTGRAHRADARPPVGALRPVHNGAVMVDVPVVRHPAPRPRPRGRRTWSPCCAPATSAS